MRWSQGSVLLFSHFFFKFLLSWFLMFTCLQLVRWPTKLCLLAWFFVVAISSLILYQLEGTAIGKFSHMTLHVYNLHNNLDNFLDLIFQRTLPDLVSKVPIRRRDEFLTELCELLPCQLVLVLLAVPHLGQVVQHQAWVVALGKKLASLRVLFFLATTKASATCVESRQYIYIKGISSPES